MRIVKQGRVGCDSSAVASGEPTTNPAESLIHWYMRGGLNSDGKGLRRLPPEREDCARDFRLQFGRRMTESEEAFLHLGNAVLDCHPEESIAIGLIDRACRTCAKSRALVSEAVRTLEASRALVTRARVLLGKREIIRALPHGPVCRW